MNSITASDPSDAWWFMNQAMRGVPTNGGGGSGGSVWADTEGRANELRTDPNMMAAMDYLRGVTGGQNVPYTPESMNAMRAQNARGTATAAGSQMSQMRDAVGAGGGSVYDPSFQAASREVDSRRQGQNLDYAGQLQAQAGQANFDARSRGAQGLAQTAAVNNAQINALLGQGAGYRAQEFTDSPQAPHSSTPSMLDQAWGGYANATQAPAMGQPAPLTSFQQQPQTSGASAPQAPATGSATGYSGSTPPSWRYIQDGSPQAGTIAKPTAMTPAPPPQTAPLATSTQRKPMTTYSTRRTA